MTYHGDGDGSNSVFEFFLTLSSSIIRVRREEGGGGGGAARGDALQDLTITLHYITLHYIALHDAVPPVVMPCRIGARCDILRASICVIEGGVGAGGGWVVVVVGGGGSFLLDCEATRSRSG